jgi:hypothetical protein
MPELEDNFAEVIVNHTAGDPMNEDVVWTNLSQQAIAESLARLGTPVSTEVVRDLLGEYGFVKRKAQKSRSMGECAHRNEQFEYLAALQDEYLDAGQPVLSVDTKKKEMLGNFFRDGQVYTTEMIETFDHDFKSHSSGLAIPHGIYDVGRNVGHITLGVSHDTSQFACDALRSWWRRHGQRAYPKAKKMLLLCDCGGSNGYRHYIFKEDLQHLANELELPIRIAHYPPYCSKYNPIEHRLFPHVTRACKGVIFHTLEIVQKFIRRTTTRTGLRITLNTFTKAYQTGRKASAEFLETLPIVFDDFLPQWNYTVVPGRC